VTDGADCLGAAKQCDNPVSAQDFARKPVPTVRIHALDLTGPEARMAAIDEDDRPKKKISHEIGQDLTLLSVEELGLRVQLMRDEIERLEADMAKKHASRSAADRFFKR
jgi:uncharacterized small protein (DUF1192 family)